MDSTLATVTALRAGGPEKLSRELSATLPLRQRLAAVVCGLSDDPFAVEGAVPIPQTPAPELDRRVRRLWALLLKAKLEKTAIP